MKVSVIIHFQKNISFLEDCLQSLVEQNYEDIEIILVCDHVEEDVESFIKTYQTKREIKLFLLKDKSGVAAARNLGISVASGEYIYFLDSDGYISDNTLGLLVSTAEENHSDLVYGKKVWTWLKRSIFIRDFNLNNNDTDDNEEDESNSSESESTNENSGEFEGKSKKQRPEDDSDEEEDNNDKVLGTNSEDELKIASILVKQNKVYSNLISSRKSLVQVSVINILMKRSLIEENNIRFKEDFILYSDYPFLLQVLTVARNLENQMTAIYIKRNHDDFVNTPSISPKSEKNSFDEYINAYKYTKDLLKSDSDLRSRLDKKIINYCIKYFAAKLSKKNNTNLQRQQFKVMSQLISDMDKNLFDKRSKYKRKLMNAFYTGDLNKATRIVGRHIIWKKLKRVTQNERAFSKFLYIHFFLKRSMKENWVFCESFFGKSYSDSPKYVYEYLCNNYPGQFRFIWVIDKKNTEIPFKNTKVKRFSIRYVYYLARCKYYVFNGRQPEWIKKRAGNVFLQTWHGTPLKRLVFDLEDINASTPQYKKQTYRQSRSWDYLIAPNQYSSDIFRRCFRYDKVMLETGYPRNDILHHENKDQLAHQIKTKLGIPKDKKIVLYAPTWRDDEYYVKGQYKFSLKLNLKLLQEELGSEYVIILRTHYFIADSLDVTGLEDFAYNLSNYDDISELYLISDILITDYSSVFFDYANLKRPMLFFTYDLEKYRDVLRGFYIDIEEELPGPLLFTTEDIIAAIRNIDNLQLEYQEKYTAFYEKFCSWEDGQASRKVANAVFKL